jgi:nanoRNase/pAp phosphatase (c-di-AMP/oligoRNAs hydrolase)
MRFCGQVLSQMELYLGGQLAIEVLPLEAPPLGLDSLHELNKRVSDVLAFAIFKPLSERRWRLSLRARKDLELGSLLAKWGGGGHSRAAGAEVEGSLEEVRQRLLDLLGPLLEKGELHEISAQ